MEIKNTKLIPPSPAIKIETLSPFTRFCVSIGMIPSSYKTSLTYEEQLLWLCNYLEETIIPTVNNNGEAVAELQALYIELKDYVDNYFTNLDVQQEINNKLDKMAEDGTLTNLIGNYIDPFILEQETKINQINSKVNQVMNGSPLVASDTSEMIDISKTYVNTSDGNWYYYNGTSWVIGGVYQSQQIAESSIEPSQLNISDYGIITSGNIRIFNNNEEFTITTRNQTYLNYKNNFINISNISNIINNTSQTFTYIVYDIVNKNFNMLSQTQLNNTNKNIYIIIAIYFNKFIYPLFNENSILTKGLKRFTNKITITKLANSSININRKNNTISFNNIYFGINNGLTNLINKTLEYNPSNIISYLTYENSTIEIHNFTDTFDYSSIIGYISNGSYFYIKECEDLLLKNYKSFYTINDMTKKLFDISYNSKVVLLGDSITHGVGGSNFEQNGETIISENGSTWKRNSNGYCYAKLLKDYLETNYNCNVINNACTGTDTNFLVRNLSTLLPSDTDFALIMYGTNDTLYDYQTSYNNLINNLNTVINYCKQNNINYIFCSPIPALDNDSKLLTHLFQINNIYKSIASNNNIEYVNMYNLIYYYCLENNKNWANYLNNDKLHPNDKGYWLMFYMLLKGLGISPSYIPIPEPE